MIDNLTPFNDRPYRLCVGLMVFNNKGFVLCGQRLDNKSEVWQLPQGGIEKNELPIEAGYRELKEETSIVNIDFVAEYPEWLNYDVPLNLSNSIWNGKYRGQTQRWLLFNFTGLDSEINIATENPEFSRWEWLDPNELTSRAVFFKKNIYSKINTCFIPMIKNFIT